MRTEPKASVAHGRWLPVGVAAAAVAAFAVFATLSLPKAIQGQPDFPNYYFAGEHLREGAGVYDSVADDVAERFGVAYDAYPADAPFTVALLAPLSYLTYETAWLLLAAVSVLMVPGVVWLTARKVGMSSLWAAAAAGLALVSTNFRFLVERNHMESLVLAAAFLGWSALRSERKEGGGFWWGVAAALKVFPGLWLIGLSGMGRWRAAMTGAVTAVALLVFGAWVIGWDESWRFVSEVLPKSSQWYGTLGNYSLLSFGTALVGEWLGWTLTALAAVVLVPWYARGAGDIDTVWSAGTALGLLLVPLAWHNYLILTFPVLVITGARMELSTPRRRLLLAWLVGALAFWGPVVAPSEAVSVLVSFVPTYALAALFVVAMQESRWRSRSETPSLASS